MEVTEKRTHIPRKMNMGPIRSGGCVVGEGGPEGKDDFFLFFIFKINFKNKKSNNSSFKGVIGTLQSFSVIIVKQE